eukprot:746476-Hanusia_phi.AAC.4
MPMLEAERSGEEGRAGESRGGEGSEDNRKGERRGEERIGGEWREEEKREERRGGEGRGKKGWRAQMRRSRRQDADLDLAGKGLRVGKISAETICKHKITRRNRRGNVHIVKLPDEELCVLSLPPDFSLNAQGSSSAPIATVRTRL